MYCSIFARTLNFLKMTKKGEKKKGKQIDYKFLVNEPTLKRRLMHDSHFSLFPFVEIYCKSYIHIAASDDNDYEEDPPLVTATVVADAEVPQPQQQKKIPPTIANVPPPPSSSTTTTTTTNGTTTTTVKTYKIQSPNAGAGSAAGGSNVPAAGNIAAGTITTYTHLGRNPTGLLCPYCSRQMVTITKDVIGISTIIAIVIICFICWPLFWLPLCIPSCKRTHHFCGHPTCRAKVGETKPCA